MAHANQQIRDRVKTLLTGLSTTGANVECSRVYPSGEDFLPGLVIWTKRMRRADGADLGKRQKYETELTVEGRAKKTASKDLDAILDDIQAEVCAALMTDPTLSHLVMSCELDDTEYDMTDLEKPAGIIRMVFLVRFMVLAHAPQTLIYAGGG